jgi:hypothetical protein
VATSTDIKVSGVPATFNGDAPDVTITVDVTSAAGAPPAVWASSTVTYGHESVEKLTASIGHVGNTTFSGDKITI